MSNPKLFPIAPQIFENRESELNSKLPEFYPDPDQRQIAEQILVPQLRSVIAEALSNFNFARGELTLTPSSPAELPNLCAEVGRALDANRNLLDSEGLGKPLFEYIQSVREGVRAEMAEAFKAHCRALLADDFGVVNRNQLIKKGVVWFVKADFPPHGKGLAFAGLVLGETVKNLSLDHLARIADTLGWPEPGEQEKLQSYRDTLATHKITDHATLLAKGSEWSRKADFPPYGKGMAFASLVLGEKIMSVTLDHFRRIAATLGWPEPSEQERLKGYRSALAIHDVTGRSILLAKGLVWFTKSDFSSYGKGKAFASLVLGETVRILSLDHIRRIADTLGWPEPNEQERLKGYRSALATHGVIDRATLLSKRPIWFTEADFPPYGKGKAFAGLVLGETVNKLSLAHLRRIADILGWPEPSEQEKLQSYRDTLATHEITDHATLLAKGPEWFKKADFPPYGKGYAFAGLILGETVRPLTSGHLHRVADILGWPKPGEQERLKGYRSALATHGVADRPTLLAKGPVWLRATDFHPYGKGVAFAGLVLGERVNPLSLDHIRRIADILFPETK